MGRLRIARVYEETEPGELRVLVDRLWPRGIARDRVDVWLKEAGPSAGVRNAFDHRAERFAVFQRDYRAELADNPAVAEIRTLAAEHEAVVLLYGAKDPHLNQAAVLLDFINGTNPALD
ncbi:DUF488 domain-containing protein [Specibacter cremeus]|uniref:DUF488 domain-containing protein n=1 Tax=Specibacter cremeus TaxID=1629051 RepID=UPI000F7B2907|nr:DUF488 family protein [Specibacter cremeus]